MQLPPLLQSKAGRIKIGAGIVVVFIIFYLIFSPSKPAPVIHPTVVAQQPEPTPEQLAPVAPPNTGNSQIILELFTPSDQTLTNQLNTTTLSQQIEQTMTVSFVLTKCQLISQDDYRDTFRALILYAQMSKLAPDEPTAEATVRQIAESAKAEYSLVYSRTSCTDHQLPTLANQVVQWTRSVLTPQPK